METNKDYIVVGYWTNTHDVIVEQVSAPTPLDAVNDVKEDIQYSGGHRMDKHFIRELMEEHFVFITVLEGNYVKAYDPF